MGRNPAPPPSLKGPGSRRGPSLFLEALRELQSSVFNFSASSCRPQLSAPGLSPERLDIARTVAAFALPEPGSPCPPFRFAICFWKPRARPTAPWCAVSERRYLMSNCAWHHCLARDPILWGPGFVRSWRSRDQRGNEERRERFDRRIKRYTADTDAARVLAKEMKSARRFLAFN